MYESKPGFAKRPSRAGVNLFCALRVTLMSAARNGGRDLKKRERKLKIDALNTVETSVETWLDFCEASMESDFYSTALERTDDPEAAAALTLLRNYLFTFNKEERARLEADVEFFYKYAEAFINELAPYRYTKDGYDGEIRSAFIGKIRTLLKAQKDESGRYLNEEKYEFIRTIVRFCSSLDFIIKVYDIYKEFLFREMPQIRHIKSNRP